MLIAELCEPGSCALHRLRSYASLRCRRSARAAQGSETTEPRAHTTAHTPFLSQRCTFSQLTSAGTVSGGVAACRYCCRNCSRSRATRSARTAPAPASSSRRSCSLSKRSYSRCRCSAAASKGDARQPLGAHRKVTAVAPSSGSSSARRMATAAAAALSMTCLLACLPARSCLRTSSETDES